jgi:UDP-GlcNAc:undecaprenyl-phosphate GlcNAc-1-phosphate transferase
MILFSTLLLSLFITITLIPASRKLAIRLHGMDMPDERKVHPYPMPKSGGIAMALGVVISVLVWAHGDHLVRAVLLGTGIVVFFGAIDDFKGLGYKTKFVGQIVAALVVILYGGVKITSLGVLLPDDMVLPVYVAMPLTLIVIVGVTNAINLSDGLDGLAGGISLLSFICIGYLAYQTGHMAIALLSIAAIGAIFGFLRFNTYPATLFMGDAGSQCLGFLGITLCLSLTQGNTPLSPLVPLLLMGFPVLDTFTVMLDRVYHGRSPFMPDKNHLHHKFMRMGLYHTEAVFVIYILQALLVTAAFVFRYHSEWLLLSVYLICSGVILVGFFTAGKTGWKVKRYHFVDKVIKGKLRVLREKQLIIKVCFRILEFGTYSLLVFTCLVPATVPGYVPWLTLALLVLLVTARVFKKGWMGGALQLSLYLLIPFVIYLSESNTALWMHNPLVRPYNLSFGVLALLVILTLKFTRRTKGFKVTPMDFLILFIALVLPNLPDAQIRSYNMGLLAVKIIVLFFTCEVLIGELRGRVNRLGLATVGALAIMSVRGFVG